jgi:hypothetical protein
MGKALGALVVTVVRGVIVAFLVVFLHIGGSQSSGPNSIAPIGGPQSSGPNSIAQSTPASNGCAAGYVPRNAVPGDNVCVTPAEESQVVNDNSQASLRVSPTGGPYGQDTCQTGYVWREATTNDHVCVTPETRTITAEENADPHLSSTGPASVITVLALSHASG